MAVLLEACQAYLISVRHAVEFRFTVVLWICIHQSRLPFCGAVWLNRSKNSTISIPTGCWLDLWHTYPSLCRSTQCSRMLHQGSSPSTDRNFLPSTSSKPALEPTQPPIQFVLGALFPGSGKAVTASVV